MRARNLTLKKKISKLEREKIQANRQGYIRNHYVGYMERRIKALQEQLGVLLEVVEIIKEQGGRG